MDRADHACFSWSAFLFHFRGCCESLLCTYIYLTVIYIIYLLKKNSKDFVEWKLCQTWAWFCLIMLWSLFFFILFCFFICFFFPPSTLNELFSDSSDRLHNFNWLHFYIFKEHKSIIYSFEMCVSFVVLWSFRNKGKEWWQSIFFNQRPYGMVYSEMSEMKLLWLSNDKTSLKANFSKLCPWPIKLA